MSLLSYHRLRELVNEGVINAPVENINGSSIDITLGNEILIEAHHGFCYGVVDLKEKESLKMSKKLLPEEGYPLLPNDFILATSQETFNLPSHISAEYKLKSSLARSGLEHLMAGWCDPGWNNSKLTLELKNLTRHHQLLLRPGMKIGQVVFWECEPVPDHADYGKVGQYNGQETVQGSKGVR